MTVLADEEDEPDEEFAVLLSNPRFSATHDQPYGVLGPAPSLSGGGEAAVLGHQHRCPHVEPEDLSDHRRGDDRG